MVNLFFTKCMANDDFSEPPRRADSKNPIFEGRVRVTSRARGSVSEGFWWALPLSLCLGGVSSQRAVSTPPPPARNRKAWRGCADPSGWIVACCAPEKPHAPLQRASGRRLAIWPYFERPRSSSPQAKAVVGHQGFAVPCDGLLELKGSAPGSLWSALFQGHDTSGVGGCHP